VDPQSVDRGQELCLDLVRFKQHVLKVASVTGVIVGHDGPPPEAVRPCVQLVQVERERPQEEGVVLR
jgi:hypothetical protein